MTFVFLCHICAQKTEILGINWLFLARIYASFEPKIEFSQSNWISYTVKPRMNPQGLSNFEGQKWGVYLKGAYIILGEKCGGIRGRVFKGVFKVLQ